MSRAPAIAVVVDSSEEELFSFMPQGPTLVVSVNPKDEC